MLGNRKIFVDTCVVIEYFSLSHNAKIQDSIIASTCLINNLPLATYNLRDFRYIPNLELL